MHELRSTNPADGKMGEDLHAENKWDAPGSTLPEPAVLSQLKVLKKLGAM